MVALSQLLDPVTPFRAVVSIVPGRSIRTRVTSGVHALRSYELKRPMRSKLEPFMKFARFSAILELG